MSTTSPSSAVVENLYQADPCAVVRFQTDHHNYELNLKGSYFNGSHLLSCAVLYRVLQSLPAFRSCDSLS